MTRNFELKLQLFAEAAAGDTAHFTGETEAAAAPQATGEETAPAAGVQDRSSAFAALIKGEYKQEYDASVQEILQKRLSGHKALTQKMEALTPALTKLAERFGVDPEDVSALTRALETAGQTSDLQTLAQKQADSWVQQAAATRQAYGKFDLQQELKDPRFAKLLQAGVDVQTAYEALHGREHFSQALAYTAMQMEKAYAVKLSAAQNRPAENGIGSGSAAVVRNDVSQMSRTDRDAIIHRVRKGETIRF